MKSVCVSIYVQIVVFYDKTDREMLLGESTLS